MIIIECVYSASNINRRHEFLTRLIGTKPEEDISFEAVNYLVTLATVSTSVAFLLEVLFYFIYNRRVSKSKDI